MKKLILLFTLLSGNLFASQDASEPEQILSMIRLLLSNSEVAGDIQAHAQGGCIWRSESLWSGTGEQIDENKWKYGGGFNIVYSSRSGREIMLSYKYTTIASEGKLSLEWVTGGLDKTVELDCS